MHKHKHNNLEKFFNDDTAPITPSTDVPSYEPTVELPPSYGGGATAADTNIASLPTQSNTGQQVLDFLGGSQLANIEKGIGGLANLGGQIATIAKNAKKGTTSSGTQPKTPAKAAEPSTILGMSPVVLVGGLVFVGLIAGVGIYFATRGGSPAAAPAGKGGK